MKSAEHTTDEKERLDALEELSAVYSPAEGRFDEITSMACRAFGVPMALVSLVAEDRQWFKSATGLNAAETPREVAFCGHAIQGSETFIVEDATEHPWFSDNPLVTGDPNVRFYAGHPLEVNGRRIGTLCLLDNNPRKLTPEQVEKLSILAKGVEEKLTESVLSKGQQALLTERSEQERRLLIDPLTKLWNRSGIEQVLLHEFRIAANEKRSLALLLLALGGTEELIREQGTEAPENVMAELASRLRAAADLPDSLGRYGEHSLIAAYDFEDEEKSAAKAQRLLDCLASAPIEISGKSVKPDVRGARITAYTPGNLGVAEAVVLTDKALAEAQKLPPGTILFTDRRQTPRD